MLQRGTPTQPSGSPPGGFSSWTKERKIYLIVGLLGCAAGILLITFSL
jgi:hypothetical protein